MVDNLRSAPLEKVGGYAVKKIRDYQTGKVYDVFSGLTEYLELPKSNVLYFELEEEAWICVRPSGTEPKIKYYFGVVGKTVEEAESNLEKLEKGLE